jgi:hypothetical protein
VASTFLEPSTCSCSALQSASNGSSLTGDTRALLSERGRPRPPPRTGPSN